MHVYNSSSVVPIQSMLGGPNIFNYSQSLISKRSHFTANKDQKKYLCLDLHTYAQFSEVDSSYTVSRPTFCTYLLFSLTHIEWPMHLILI